MGVPCIVVWEGVDGAGKTTLMNRVKEILEDMGFRVLTYKTPSGSPTGEFAVKYGNEPGIDPFTRMLLFLANTSDDSKRMREELAQSPDFYFIDRYYLCSIVYGLAFLRLGGAEVSANDFFEFLNIIEKLGERVFLKPDLYVIVDAPEENRLKRLMRKRGQGGVEEELEQNVSMQNYVRELYRVFADARRNQVLWVVNPEGGLEEVAKMVAKKLSSTISQR